MKISRRTFVLRTLGATLMILLLVGAFAGWRAYRIYQAAYGGYQHWRHLLESGETIEGAPAEDVLSDDYLHSLFAGNPELVERLKAVIDLGMAADESLKLGSISAMMVTYQKNDAGEVSDPAIYAIGGFPDPKSRRIGFHSTGYLSQELDPGLWLTGFSVMNLLGRDIIIFCEQDTVEQHMALLYDLLDGEIYSLAQRVVNSTLHYSLVFPEPKNLAPPSLKNHLQTVMCRGEMGADHGKSEIVLISPSIRSAYQTSLIFKDLAMLARVTFHDHFSGYIKEMNFGPMNDTWWAVEYVEMIDNLKIIHDQILVTARTEYDREQNNAILKTIERAGRDIAMQKAFSIAGDLPWEFAYRARQNPSGGYWGEKHRWGSHWPLGDEGIPTPGSMAAAAERQRLIEEAERQRLERLQELHEQQQQQRQSIPTADESTS